MPVFSQSLKSYVLLDGEMPFGDISYSRAPDAPSIRVFDLAEQNKKAKPAEYDPHMKMYPNFVSEPLKRGQIKEIMASIGEVMESMKGPFHIHDVADFGSSRIHIIAVYPIDIETLREALQVSDVKWEQAMVAPHKNARYIAARTMDGTAFENGTMGNLAKRGCTTPAAVTRVLSEICAELSPRFRSQVAQQKLAI